MLLRTKPLAHTILALLTTGLASSFAGSSSVAEPTPAEMPAQWNQPIAFSLEARSVEHDAAFGMHVVRPVFHSRSAAVLVEGYGFEGEEELGLAGGGVIYRRSVSSRGTFEASAFFEGLRSTDGFSYPQLGAGIAFSPDRWVTLRANGYLPLRGKDSRHSGTDRWSETEGSGADRREVDFSRERRSERAPMRGFDVEAELRLPEPPRWVDPRLAVGYAYREAEDLPEVHAGVTVRGELHFAKHWVVEGEWRDDMHGVEQEWRVGVRFQMLLGGAPASEGHRAPVAHGKNAVPMEDASEREDSRADERYLPVQRFPWPTVARGSSRGSARRGGSRSLAPVQAQPQSPADPGDCCNSGKDPLIFE